MATAAGIFRLGDGAAWVTERLGRMESLWRVDPGMAKLLMEGWVKKWRGRW